VRTEAIVADVYGLDIGMPKLGGGSRTVGLLSDGEWRCVNELPA
jgi:hypothetical protein